MKAIPCHLFICHSEVLCCLRGLWTEFLGGGVFINVNLPAFLFFPRLKCNNCQLVCNNLPWHKSQVSVIMVWCCAYLHGCQELYQQIMSDEGYHGVILNSATAPQPPSLLGLHQLAQLWYIGTVRSHQSSLSLPPSTITTMGSQITFCKHTARFGKGTIFFP